VIAVANRQRRVAVSAAQVRAVVEAAFAQERAGTPNVSVALVNDAAIAAMNRRWLGHEGPTDSIAFSFEGDPGPDGLRGEVVASAETALREARARRLDPAGELLLYVAHGVLHLLGWEDGSPRARAAMNARARRAVRAARAARPARRAPATRGRARRR
jgi:probable rRNA maturation factor